MTSILLNKIEFELIDKTLQVAKCQWDIRIGIIVGIALLSIGAGVKHFIHNTTGKVLMGLSIVAFSFSGYRYFNKITLEQELKPQATTITQAFEHLSESLQSYISNRNLMVESYVSQQKCPTKDACVDVSSKGLVSYLKGKSDKFKNLSNFNQDCMDNTLKFLSIAEDIKLYLRNISWLPVKLITILESSSTCFLGTKFSFSEKNGVWQVKLVPNDWKLD